MKSESLITEESRAHTLSAHLLIARGLLDPVPVGLLVLVVISVVLRFGHTKAETRTDMVMLERIHTLASKEYTMRPHHLRCTKPILHR